MGQSKFKHQIYTVIFGTDTPAGKYFDVALLYCILISVFAVMLDTVKPVNQQFGEVLWMVEWFFTLLFSVEYLLRIYSSPNRVKYLFSFFGIIDLISIVPTYLALVVSGANYLLVVRLLRILRVFRIFKMVRYLADADMLLRSIWQSRRRISIFFLGVLVISVIFGCLMYVVEGSDNGFTSIPQSVYWTIVTITTVGYGDITPHTVLGKMIASMAMLVGYSIIAIPTGIITAELAGEIQRNRRKITCENCQRTGHEQDAAYCKWCGASMRQT